MSGSGGSSPGGGGSAGGLGIVSEWPGCSGGLSLRIRDRLSRKVSINNHRIRCLTDLVLFTGAVVELGANFNGDFVNFV